MPTFHHPCHDPHRVDAVLACMIDRAHEVPPDDPREGCCVLPLALEFAVDRRALLDLLPVTGSDALAAEGLVEVARGFKVDHTHAQNLSASARQHAVAARLACTAVALAVDPDGRQAAAILWRAAGALAGLAAEPAATPATPSSTARRLTQKAYLGTVAVLLGVFSRAGVPVEFREKNDGKVWLVAAKPTAEQNDAISRMFAAGLDLTVAQTAATEGRRRWLAKTADGSDAWIRWSVVGEEDEVRT